MEHIGEYLTRLIKKGCMTSLFIVLSIFFNSCTSTEDSNFVFVNIRNFDRVQLSYIIKKIDESSPKLMLIDVWFSTNKQPEVDSILTETLSNVGSDIVFASSYDDFFRESNGDITGEGKVETLPSFRKPGSPEGHVDTFYEMINGKPVPKSFPVEIKTNDLQKTSMHASILCAYLVDSTSTADYLSNRNNEIDVKLRRDRIDNYHRLDLSFDEFLSYERWAFLENKIVILAYIGPTNEDKKYTQLNKSNYTEPDTYGSIILGEIISETLGIE